ncbi:sulfur transferase domain-containing protein [Devosia sp. A8/3-2]|nr:sulfur transferase domain-containing protein [Devosia sp. A8/3-2]
MKRINENVSVSGQIQPEDIAALKARGFTTIINNRPEGEIAGPAGRRRNRGGRQGGGAELLCYSTGP